MRNHTLGRRGFFAGVASAAAGLLVGARAAWGQTPAPPRNVRIVPGPGSQPAPAGTLTASDFKYLGSYRIPSPAQGDISYGNGLYLRREPGDPTNPVHLGAAAYSPVSGPGIMGHAFEWRDATPTNPASPSNPASYGTATMVKEWGNLYGSAPSKRVTTLNGQTYDFSDGKAGTLRWGGLGWDPVNGHLYWTFGETYSNDSDVYYLGYSELNYSTSEVTAHGAWTTAATQFKGGLSGVLSVPSAFVKAAGLGTKRLATIGTPPASLQANGDVSPGPQLTVFTPPVGVTERTSLASTRLVGYAPFTNDPGPGHDRATRPASIQWFQGPGSAAVIPFSNWPQTKWNGYDATYGGVWIHGPSKSGFVTVNQLFKGQVTYLYAQNVPEMTVNTLSIVSESDLLSVAQGKRQPYEIQPATTELTWPVMNPADYTSVQLATVATVTSTRGDKRSAGAILTTTAAHGFPVSGLISVQGTSVAEYNDNWVFVTLNATQIRISNPSLDSYVFSGTMARGGTLRTLGHGGYPGSGIRILGLAFDEITSKLYLGFLAKDGSPMVSVWAVTS